MTLEGLSYCKSLGLDADMSQFPITIGVLLVRSVLNWFLRFSSTESGDTWVVICGDGDWIRLLFDVPVADKQHKS